MLHHRSHLSKSDRRQSQEGLLPPPIIPGHAVSRQSDGRYPCQPRGDRKDGLPPGEASKPGRQPTRAARVRIARNTCWRYCTVYLYRNSRVCDRIRWGIMIATGIWKFRTVSKVAPQLLDILIRNAVSEGAGAALGKRMSLAPESDSDVFVDR